MARKKIDRLSENFNKKSPYYPTLTDAELWFDILNNIIFKRKLPAFDSISIRRLRGAVGQVVFEDQQKLTRKRKRKPRECHLELHYKMKSFNTFLEVLGHEMVHLLKYYMLEDNSCNHNIDFYKWRRVFGANGLKLTLTVDNETTNID